MLLRPLSSCILLVFLVFACGKERPAKPSTLETPDAAAELTATENSITIQTGKMGGAKVYKYLDLDSGKLVEVEDPQADQVWDLSFQFYNIASNGGSSGKADVLVTHLETTPFDTLKKAPTGPYLHDVASDPANFLISGLAFLRAKGWFIYFFLEHDVIVRDRLYVVRSSEGKFFKVKIESFDKSGELKLRWAPLEDPDRVEEAADQVPEAIEISMVPRGQ